MVPFFFQSQLKWSYDERRQNYQSWESISIKKIRASPGTENKDCFESDVNLSIDVS